ncbi:helix-turn-helix domain-containing protein [Streptomyces chartreusis]|uniref:Helix-turn-helix domain-containing protein n=1 Tax=Streptomyces chartreusis TaxID=1969 RepID=A0A7H8TCI2_STRCX|nr:helix-turn-helix domain-containing protein [Streptomyces chartreusis]QKZ21074.1 helix-turn-helix domain-containing protein [Streptomyces chartreusis]
MSQTLQERILYGSTEDRTCGGDAEPTTILRSWSAVRGPESFPLGTLKGSIYSSDDRVEAESYCLTQASGIALGLALQGEVTVSQAERSVTLHPGQFTFYAGTQPFAVRAPAAHKYLVVTIPLFTIGLRLIDLSGMLAAGVPGPLTSSTLLSETLTTLATSQSELSPRARQQCGNAVVALIQGVISDHQADEEPTRMLSLFNLLAQSVEHHLTEEALDAESLAAAHHLSARYVRQIFAARQSTVSRYVRERRLEHARSDLVHPALATHSVAAIGRHWGFHDAAVFSRAFKAQYGQPPQTYRRMHSRL